MKYIFISCILHCLVISLKTLKIFLLLNLVTTIANKFYNKMDNKIYNTVGRIRKTNQKIEETRGNIDIRNTQI
jgi:hypothetical protein